MDEPKTFINSSSGIARTTYTGRNRTHNTSRVPFYLTRDGGPHLPVCTDGSLVGRYDPGGSSPVHYGPDSDDSPLDSVRKHPLNQSDSLSSRKVIPRVLSFTPLFSSVNPKVPDLSSGKTYLTSLQISNLPKLR